MACWPACGAGTLGSDICLDLTAGAGPGEELRGDTSCVWGSVSHTLSGSWWAAPRPRPSSWPQRQAHGGLPCQGSDSHSHGETEGWPQSPCSLDGTAVLGPRDVPSAPHRVWFWGPSLESFFFLELEPPGPPTSEKRLEEAPGVPARTHTWASSGGIWRPSRSLASTPALLSTSIPPK